jgi:hypothetical protein
MASEYLERGLFKNLKVLFKFIPWRKKAQRIKYDMPLGANYNHTCTYS